MDRLELQSPFSWKHGKSLQEKYFFKRQAVATSEGEGVHGRFGKGRGLILSTIRAQSVFWLVSTDVS